MQFFRRINMKKLLKILVIIAVIFAGVIFLKNQIIKNVMTSVVSSVVGAPLKIKEFSLGLLSQKVSIKGLKLLNPQGFPEGTLIDIEEITVAYDLPALMKKQLHLPLIVVDLNEMVLIKNKQGQLNVDALKVSTSKDYKEKQTEVKKKKEEKSEMMPLHIELLKLNIGKVVYKDFSAGDQPVVKVYDVGFKDKEFKDIRSIEEFATTIMVTAMGSTAVQGAKIYGAMTVLGAGFLPVGAAALLISDDDAAEIFKGKYEDVYVKSLNVIKQIGKLKKEDQIEGRIKAKVDGCDLTIEIKKHKEEGIQVKVSARKFMIPKPKIAGGVLHQISENLSKK